jgi:hypothetical protein
MFSDVQQSNRRDLSKMQAISVCYVQASHNVCSVMLRGCCAQRPGRWNFGHVLRGRAWSVRCNRSEQKLRGPHRHTLVVTPAGKMHDHAKRTGSSNSEKGTKMARQLVLSTLFGLSTSAAAAVAEPSTKESQLLSDFEAICVTNANNPNAITQLLSGKGSNETGQFSAEISGPPPISGAFKALLMPLEGKSFKIKDDVLDVAIAITDTGACSLSSPDVNGEAVEKVLKDRMFTNQIGKEVTAGVAHTTYASSYPTPVDTLHALIFVDRPLRVNSSGVRLSSLGDLYLRARVPNEPEWPVIPSGSEPKVP